ncbi:MAG: tRNA uridine-5-carboxymethylaminomethyl(34) synthesis GTPase MnmE [Spirosomaceae bacterium]|nr:tRNA uridine-5-carboxymethylaminomethyl(34) synthesis GTPase MnmE [Spirosomataceae bacterium]
MAANVHQYEPICALATAPGVGAISVIRVSGLGAIAIVDKLFFGKNLLEVASHTAHFGTIRDGEQIIDEVLVTVFKSPKSFTKEDCVEIGCHGSDYIVRYILKLLVKNGCTVAKPGEFTQRAFLNGQFDLVQAEAVADLIAADSEAAHKIALGQMRGGFSKKLGVLREELIHFASMIELELDFGEEDVEFADRDDLRQLIYNLKRQLNPLIDSFEAGNAIKEGTPVAIIGPPNAGKSTLLNILLNEEKAIVTEIAGTTRDVIEDVLFIDGRKFRFIDTAGIRETTDIVESIGIKRSMTALEKAHIAIMLFDNEADEKVLRDTFVEALEGKEVLWVRNKVDLVNPNPQPLPLRGDGEQNSIPISAKNNTGIEELKELIVEKAGKLKASDTTLTNLRHYESLVKTQEALDEVLIGLDNGITGDFLAQDIRLSLHHLGEITGSISSDDLLKNIFGKFCIGK